MNRFTTSAFLISLIIGPPAFAVALPQMPAAAEAPPAKSIPELKRLIDRGHTEEAMKDLDQLAAQKPVPAGVDRLRGDVLYAQANYVSADQAFANALGADPKDREAAQMRGLTLFRLGRAADAIPLLEGAREATAQTKADPNYVLALCYLETRRYDDARHAFAVQYGFAPDSANAYLLSARMLFRREYVPIAQEFAHKALELDPNLPLAHLLLGEIALSGQHIDEAIAELEKERAHNPLEPSTYDRLGDAYARAGRYPEAEKALQQALLLEPNATGPYILLGKVLLKRDDPATAAGYLERAQAMDPGNYMTHGLLGQAYRAMGRTEDASRELQEAETLQAANTPKLTTPK
jgi:predicted Zn-dependent protease